MGQLFSLPSAPSASGAESIRNYGDCREDAARESTEQQSTANTSQCPSSRPTVDGAGSVTAMTHVNGEPAREERAVQVNRLYLGNISWKTSRRQLLELLAKFGKVREVVVPHSQKRSRPRGFAFVEFREARSAEAMLSLTEESLSIHGRCLIIKPAFASKLHMQRNLEKHQREALSSICREMPAPPASESDEASGQKLLCCVNSLPDDVFLLIFQKLGIKDRVSMERVCKHWYRLSRASWQYLKELDFTGLFSLASEHYLTDNLLRALLRRGCHSLVKLDLSSVVHGLSASALSSVAASCPGLQQINLNKMNLCSYALQALGEGCPQLRVLHMATCDVGNKAIWSILKHCKKLEHLDVSANARISGKCFYQLGPRLQCAILDECCRIDEKALSLIADRCPDLQELSLARCRRVADGAVGVVATRLRHLRVLSLAGNKATTETGLSRVSQLVQLRHLDLSENAGTTDRVLRDVASGCKHLQHLNVSSCSNGVGDDGIRSLAKLPCLTSLLANYLGNVTDDSIRQLAYRGRLEVLEVKACIRLTDEGVISIGLHCPRLRHLDVCGNEAMTFELVRTLFRACEERQNDVTLQLLAGDDSSDDEYRDNDDVDALLDDCYDLHCGGDGDMFQNGLLYSTDDDDNDDARSEREGESERAREEESERRRDLDSDVECWD
ncbi:PREDICTED: putative RNA-binding protein EEED8.10 isoform X2 [Priapulus caudatus]|uniref:RNA-binding protein EEED8.10 isoform X2 n=1 Tax=Priapulus caudatus TaxID=37621 RepID=A0ABM1ECJ6_PRICU|nr:PREDICTED: putative RNA-binding protein EEED8.10 isoform X2 [Priapulus caudatus]